MRSGSSNSRNLWSRVTRWLLAGVLLIITAAVVVEAKAWFAFANEKQSLTGVRNFGRVETRLYRGGQPSDAGFVALKNLGIDIVVSFRSEEHTSELQSLTNRVCRLLLEKKHDDRSH